MQTIPIVLAEHGKPYCFGTPITLSEFQKALFGRDKHEPLPRIVITAANGATHRDVQHFLDACFALGVTDVEIMMSILTVKELSDADVRTFGKQASNKELKAPQEPVP